MKRVHEQLNAGTEVERSPVPSRASTVETVNVCCCINLPDGTKVRVHGGGDCSDANAQAGLDSPVASYGCCAWCPDPKNAWLDDTVPELRDFFSDTAAAHLCPYAMLGIAPPVVAGKAVHAHCPYCRMVLSPKNVKEDGEAFDKMAATAKKKFLTSRRATHGGKHFRRPKLARADHKYRQFSGLHLRLNGSANTSLGVLTAGSTNALRGKLNRIVEKYHIVMHWKETGKWSSDKKPDGPQCRKLDGRKGRVWLELLRTRYNRDLATGEPNPPPKRLQKPAVAIGKAGAKKLSALAARRAELAAAVPKEEDDDDGPDVVNAAYVADAADEGGVNETFRRRHPEGGRRLVQVGGQRRGASHAPQRSRR